MSTTTTGCGRSPYVVGPSAPQDLQDHPVRHVHRPPVDADESRHRASMTRAAVTSTPRRPRSSPLPLSRQGDADAGLLQQSDLDHRGLVTCPQFNPRRGLVRKCMVTRAPRWILEHRAGSLERRVGGRSGCADMRRSSGRLKRTIERTFCPGHSWLMCQSDHPWRTQRSCTVKRSSNASALPRQLR